MRKVTRVSQKTRFALGLADHSRLHHHHIEAGKLMGAPDGQPKAELYPTTATEFFLKVVNAQITFVKNEQGLVTQLILHQNGRNMPAKKIR
jgi:hypothetical protein